jgi:site-specific DNA-adenine methylase
MSTADLPVTTCLAPWFGANRLLAPAVGEELAGSRWVGIPFAGGMSELCYLTAPTILVNDQHRLIMNLAWVLADKTLGPKLIRQLRRLPFHPDILRGGQIASTTYEYCDVDFFKGVVEDERRLHAATWYFVACWMGRSGKSGIDDEFNGRLSTRWNANGGDSNTRYRSAVSSLLAWRKILQKCSFSVLDVFEFLDRCEDSAGHAIYCDPPFPKLGGRYKHKFSVEEHRLLAGKLLSYQNARVVCRFYDDPLIRDLYPEGKQSNAEAPEVLTLNGPSQAKSAGLF